MKKQLKFWGTRGSCSVSGPEYTKFGGNTNCLELTYEDRILIFDAGSGIRALGESLSKQNIRKIDLLLSHTHWDHLAGFPFFEPLYNKDCEITIWAPQGNLSCQAVFLELLSPEFFPVKLEQMRARFEFKDLIEGTPIHLGPLKIESCQTRHTTTTYGFKITTPHQTISYITDNEAKIDAQKKFIEFNKNVDIFIHEVQYDAQEYKTKQGWGHSCLANAVALVNEINPKLWLVVHHDPAHTDMDLQELEKIAQKSTLPCPVVWVPDGYEVTLL